MNARLALTIATLTLMLVYQGIVGALATHVPGFDLPPAAVYVLTVLGPVVLLAAHAIPSVFNQLSSASDAPPSRAQ